MHENGGPQAGEVTPPLPQGWACSSRTATGDRTHSSNILSFLLLKELVHCVSYFFFLLFFSPSFSFFAFYLSLVPFESGELEERVSKVESHTNREVFFHSNSIKLWRWKCCLLKLTLIQKFIIYVRLGEKLLRQNSHRRERLLYNVV